MVEEKFIGIGELVLDQRNYRIDFERYKTLEEIVERLYLDEDIVGMINGIVTFRGVYPHEKLIVVPLENGKYRVVEGNRRVLAIKGILGEISPPAKFAKKVAGLISMLTEAQLDSLKYLGAVVYDVNDKDYLKILADKHSTLGYVHWGQISQWHFFKDLYDTNGKDIEQTASDLGRSRGEVGSYIRFHNLFRYIRAQSYWDEHDLRDKIESNTLEPTKFTRPLGYKQVQSALGLKFGEDYEVLIPHDGEDVFSEILCRYARAALLSDSSDDDYIFTRTEPDSIISMIDGWKQELKTRDDTEKKEGKPKEGPPGAEKNEDKGVGSGGQKGKSTYSGTPKGKNPVRYFSDLKCSVDNQRLKRLTRELSRITMTQFPSAAIMLTRSLLESALIFQIEKNNLVSEYHQYKGKDGLKKILNYSISAKQKLFKDPKSANGLEYLETSKYKDFMDDIVHSKWIDPTDGDVAIIAGKIRELLKAILSDNA